MNVKDERMIAIIKKIIKENSAALFLDNRRAVAVISDYIVDPQLMDEKNALKRVIQSGAMKYLATDDKQKLLLGRKNAFYILTEREFISEIWAERILKWFDCAIDDSTDSISDVDDFVCQFANESKVAKNEKKQSSKAEFMSPIDMLLDEDNNDNIVLFNEDNQQIEFEQIALVPIQNRVYALLKPVLSMEGIADDEALVFAIEEVDGEDCLVIVEEDEIIDKVFEEYYEMLRAEGIDVD